MHQQGDYSVGHCQHGWPTKQKINCSFHKNNHKYEDSLSSKFNFEKNIKISEIDFNYPHSKENIFENFTLEIKHGSKFGIIGKSGSGKTTLVNLITGLLNPNLSL